MANVNGNWKGGKAITKYSRTKALGTKAKFAVQKGAGKIARNYKRYVSPSTKIVKGIGKLGLGVGKTLLRFPGTALIGTGLYYGGKALGKKYGRGYRYSAVRQFDKKGRKRI
mgnify:CR=1 FL=1